MCKNGLPNYMDIHHMSVHANMHPHAHFTSYEQKKIFESAPQTICPLCRTEMEFVLSYYMKDLACFMYTWICERCDIRREQVYDDARFNPRQWHRVKYIFPDNTAVYEDETVALARKIGEYAYKGERNED